LPAGASLRMVRVELDGQGIERRDFPISRRGYEPAAVDGHLRAVASAVEELRRQAQRGESLGANAASQVQGILEAAEATAAGIVSGAEETARRAIESAEMDARRTREDAVSRAEAHVSAVAEATAALRSRVEAMDGELRGMVESLRGGASRLSGDLSTLEREMGALYDAASGRAQAAAQGAALAQATASAQAPAEPRASAPNGGVSAAHELAYGQPSALEEPQAAPVPAQAHLSAIVEEQGAAPQPSLATPAGHVSAEPAIDAEDAPVAQAPSGGADLDGARLVALNMALNGDPREATDRYLSENFDLPERAKLIDEVYAAIDG